MLRWWGLVTAFLVFTALPVAAADEEGGSTELEVAVAEGSGTGTFGCGQPARVRYVRAAVQVRHTEASADPERGGATVLLGTAVDVSRVVALEDEELLEGVEPTDESPAVAAGDTWIRGRFGGHLRIGYRHRFFGIEGGAGVVIAPDAWTLIYPDAELTLGPRDRFWGFVGVGAAQVTTQLAFAQPYLGLGAQPAPWLRLEGRWGLYFGGGSDVADRVDVIWWVPCSKVMALRGGWALGQFGGQHPISHEASLGLAFTP